MTSPNPPPSTIVLGTVTIRPASCEVIAGTNRIVIEPQVMRVLATLAQDVGTVVSRDELVAKCWDGRSVSEDAINRVISRLRKLAVETGAFELQTQRKVGYRIVPTQSVEPAEPATVAPLTPPARRRPKWLGVKGAVFLLMLLVAVAAWIAGSRSPKLDLGRSLAIQFTTERPDEYGRVQALTANLRQSLARVRGLQLVNHSAASRTDLVLDGSFGSSPERPILLTLKDGASGSPIWSGRFGRSPLLLPEDQRAVAAAVRYVAVWLSDGSAGPITAREPERSDVVALVTAGSQAWQIGGRERQSGDVAAAARHYALASAKADAALALNPESSQALMLRYQVDQIPTYPRPGESEAQFRVRMQRVDEMLTRALSADPDDPAVLVAAAQDFARASDWEAAGALLRRAVRLGPTSADANTWYAYHLALIGRCREDQLYARKAVSLDPTTPWRRRVIPRLSQCAGDTLQALRDYARLLRSDRENASLAYEAYLVALSGDPPGLSQLSAFLRRDLWSGNAPDSILRIADRADAAAAARDGHPVAFKRILDGEFYDALNNRKLVSAGSSGDTMFALAYEYAHADQVDRALEVLRRAHDAGSTYLPWALPFGSHEFPEPLRSDPRYKALWRGPPTWPSLMARRSASKTEDNDSR